MRMGSGRPLSILWTRMERKSRSASFHSFLRLIIEYWVFRSLAESNEPYRNPSLTLLSQRDKSGRSSAKRRETSQGLIGLQRLSERMLHWNWLLETRCVIIVTNSIWLISCQFSNRRLNKHRRRRWRAVSKLLVLGKLCVVFARVTISPPNVLTKIPLVASKTPVRFI